MKTKQIYKDLKDQTGYKGHTDHKDKTGYKDQTDCRDH